jgi:4-hydroxybenzoate polyprenyltransferase
LIAFIKLIRIKNLLIIAFTQYMVRWFIVHPGLTKGGLHFHLSEIQFFFLSLSTVMIAAAGYIINDYFDVRIDKVNKPEKMVIDKGVKRRVAIGAHTVINIFAILIGLWISYSAGDWKLVFLHIFCTLGLWLYSTTFKRKFFIGNLVIALFTAFVPLIVGIYELIPLDTADMNEYQSIIGAIWTPVFAISFFAFITTLLREIIKDIEDLDGDKEYGCKTMPIVIGINSTKWVIIILCSGTIISLAYIQFLMLMRGQKVPIIYILAALQIPLLFLIWRIYTARSKKEYHIAGNTAKFIMLLGICYLFIHSQVILNSL